MNNEHLQTCIWFGNKIPVLLRQTLNLAVVTTLIFLSPDSFGPVKSGETNGEMHYTNSLFGEYTFCGCGENPLRQMIGIGWSDDFICPVSVSWKLRCTI